jgi:hypothetical protein
VPGEGVTNPRIYLPDYLTDSTNRRRVKLHRRLGDGAGLIPRFIVATDHAPLSWVTLPLGHGPLYARETKDRAFATTAALVGASPAWCALHRGVEGGLHPNILIPTAAVPRRRDLPTGAHVVDVTDLVGLFHYLGGPPDARCNYKNKDPRTGIHHRTTAEQHAAAQEEYVAAKAQGRLHRMQWSHNLPRMKVLALILEQLQAELDQVAD